MYPIKRHGKCVTFDFISEYDSNKDTIVFNKSKFRNPGIVRFSNLKYGRIISLSRCFPHNNSLDVFLIAIGTGGTYI